jgi:hypothetical protein
MGKGTSRSQLDLPIVNRLSNERKKFNAQKIRSRNERIRSVRNEYKI